MRLISYVGSICLFFVKWDNFDTTLDKIDMDRPQKSEEEEEG